MHKKQKQELGNCSRSLLLQWWMMRLDPWARARSYKFWCAVSRSLDVDHAEVVDFFSRLSVILFAFVER